MCKRKKIFIISSSLLFIAIVGAVLFVSLVKFGSINIPRIAYAIVSVNNGSKDYVVIKDCNTHEDSDENKEDFFAIPKKIIIATPDGDYCFDDYVKSIDYEITEQYGSQVTIDKDDHKEFVYVTINRYYSLWLWDD